MKEGPLWNTLMLEGPRLSIRQFLPAHEHVNEEFEAFACFMQATSRKRPPLKPARLHSCDAMTLRKCQLDEYRFPPYQYKPQYLVKNSKTQERAPPRAALRAELMGFKGDHTFACMDRSGRKSFPKAFEDLRCSLLGNSIHAPTLALLLAPQLVEWKLLPRLPTLEEICQV